MCRSFVVQAIPETGCFLKNVDLQELLVLGIAREILSGGMQHVTLYSAKRCYHFIVHLKYHFQNKRQETDWSVLAILS